jgi:hypothetical protein
MKIKVDTQEEGGNRKAGGKRMGWKSDKEVNMIKVRYMHVCKYHDESLTMYNLIFSNKKIYGLIPGVIFCYLFQKFYVLFCLSCLPLSFSSLLS